MPTIAVIQARMGSTRFPRKSAALWLAKPLIQHVIDRVRQVETLAEIRLAVPPQDAEAFTSLDLGVCVYAPEVAEADVLGRFAAATTDLDPSDWVLRVTGDCPLWNPEVGRRLLAERGAWDNPAWATADTTCSGYADGEDAELFPVWLLRAAARYAVWPLDREHVTRWMRRRYPPATLEAPEDRGHLKLSIDTPEDLTRVREYLWTREQR